MCINNLEENVFSMEHTWWEKITRKNETYER